MNNKEQLLQFFNFLKSKRNKNRPAKWMVVNYENQASDDEFRKINYLDLGHKRLTSVPTYILKCENLQALYLHNNSISKIENLQNCKRLNELVIAYNNITKIEGLENLTQLTELNLNNNNISVVNNLENNYRLTTLFLMNNNIKTIPDLEYLKLLRFMSFDVQSHISKAFKQIHPNCHLVSN